MQMGHVLYPILDTQKYLYGKEYTPFILLIELPFSISKRVYLGK